MANSKTSATEKARFRAAAGVEVMIEAMHRHAEEMSVQEACSGLLQALAHHDKASQIAIINAGGVKAMATALVKHVHGRVNEPEAEPAREAKGDVQGDRLTCRNCGMKFTSRTKLFKHLQGDATDPSAKVIAVGLKVKLKETGNIHTIVNIHGSGGGGNVTADPPFNHSEQGNIILGEDLWTYCQPIGTVGCTGSSLHGSAADAEA